MKHKKTIFLAVLAFCLLAGCSSDDLSEVVEKKPVQGVTVNVEQLQDGDSETRAAYTASNQLYWQQGDGIMVYDEQMEDYDPYTFQLSKGAFTAADAETTITGTATYALAPISQLYMAGWTKYGLRGIIEVPIVLNYNAKSEDTSTLSGTKLYAGDIPMWGKVSGTFNDITVSLKYLTAVMKLRLTGVKGKATYVKISSETKPLSGGFEVLVASKDGKEVYEDTALKKGTAALATQSYIIVDLRSMPGNDATVFLPIIADTYDDLTVSYTTDDVLTYKDNGELVNTSVANATWKDVKVYPKGQQMKRNHGYTVSKVF